MIMLVDVDVNVEIYLIQIFSNKYVSYPLKIFVSDKFQNASVIR